MMKKVLKSLWAGSKPAIDIIKHNLPGISSAAGMELMAGVSHLALRDNNQQMHAKLAQTSMAMPMLTNFGIVARYPILFGGLVVEEAYMTAPIMYSPYFFMGASSYNGALTLSIGFHSPTMAEKRLTSFSMTWCRANLLTLNSKPSIRGLTAIRKLDNE